MNLFICMSIFIYVFEICILSLYFYTMSKCIKVVKVQMPFIQPSQTEFNTYSMHTFWMKFVLCFLIRFFILLLAKRIYYSHKFMSWNFCLNIYEKDYFLHISYLLCHPFFLILSLVKFWDKIRCCIIMNMFIELTRQLYHHYTPITSYVERNIY